MNEEHQKYLRRCRQLARLGSYSVSPNPPVGSVLVWNNRIIGEGFHKKHGSAHAEVEALNSVDQADIDKLSESTLYVSLEPCNHYGQTPPCTELIIKSKIPRVIIGARDPFITSKGRGMEYLRNHGVDVQLIDLYPTSELKYFKESIQVQRPWITLKYALSRNGYIGIAHEQVHLSNALSQRWVHALRSKSQAILVGTNSIITDNPWLNNRKFFGTTPTIIVLDRKSVLSGSEKVFNGEQILYFTSNVNKISLAIKNNPRVKMKQQHVWSVSGLIKAFSEEGIKSVFVEGGRKLLESFINEGYWDECYELRSTHQLADGIEAPVFINRKYLRSFYVGNDKWDYFMQKDSTWMANYTGE